MAGRKRKRKPSRAAASKVGNGAAKVRGRAENLKPAKPGEVRNPLGINGSTWLKEFKDYFAGEVSEDLPRGKRGLVRPGERRIDAIKRSLFMKAVFGDPQAQKLIIEQVQGRARQHVELTGKDGAPLAPPATVRLYMPSNGRENENPEDEIKEPKPDGSSGD
jgi:hypothetical protein